jgi:putative cell wall-binding protein
MVKKLTLLVALVIGILNIGSVSADNYNVVITTSDFADILHHSKAKIVRIDNMMDKVC